MSFNETDQSIEDFINSNPYPSISDMSLSLNRRWDLDAEYGEMNHSLCKLLYENLHKDDKTPVLNNFINTIKSTGGNQALKCNIETVKLFSPIATCKNTKVKSSFNEMYNSVISELNR
jgi:hypothetical protein